jgi:hypothetical protein
MPLAIVLLVLKVLAIVHVLRTGRERWWILVIALLPGIGLLVYTLFEILPSLSQSLTGRRAVRRVQSAVDPDRGVREAQLEYDRNANVETAARLAQELTAVGRFDDAVRICNAARTGLFENDPKLLLALAGAQFGANRHADVIATIDTLRATHPRFHTPDGHLLYARALEASGSTARALGEYAALADYFPGAEARVRYAMLCRQTGNIDQARNLFAALLTDARLAPEHVRRSQREWLDIAARESTQVEQPGESDVGRIGQQ